MRIWFLAREHLPFSPASVHRRQIGGSEIALYYVTKGLAGLGHEVVVLNQCGPETGLYDGVRYYDAAAGASQWRAEARAKLPDVLVVCRRMLDVLAGIPARAKVFWAHDYQGVPMESLRSGVGRPLGIAWRRTTGPLFHQRVDRIFVISRFLADVFRWLFRAPAEKLVIIPQGIEADLFAGPFPPREPRRFIQTSVPDRGLAPLLQGIFPAIRHRFPDAELHVYSYHPLDTYKKYSTPGVHLHGWVPKSELVRSLRQSALMLYPATVEEMGCIAVLESMAAGTPAVTSSLGVLPELAGEGTRGIAVEGWPGTPNFASRFIEATATLLSDTHRLDRMGAAAHDYAITHHSWSAIAGRWHQMLHATLDAATGST
jgi:glycosyltransferase involved in cell wall biosynthesis